MPPESIHRWSIQCPRCKKQLHWGSVAGFEQMLAEGDSDETVLFLKDQVPPPDPFAPFYVDDPK